MTQRRLRFAAALVGVLALAVVGCRSSDGPRVASARPFPSATGGPTTGGLTTTPPTTPPVTTAPSPTRPSTTHPTRRPPTTRPPAPTTKPPSPPGPGFPYGARSTTGMSGVALTFDDGPTWAYTKDLLAVLREHGVKATFCMIGKMARTYPDRVREIVAGGHSLCNHSDDHDFGLGRRTEAEIRANLQRANDAIRAAAGPDARISYYRQPGGNWTPRVVKVAEEMGMTSLHWSVDPRDWEGPPSAHTIAHHVMSHTRPGSIVLLHDGGGDRSNTVQACRSMLANLKSRFQLIPLPPRAAP